MSQVVEQPTAEGAGHPARVVAGHPVPAAYPPAVAAARYPAPALAGYPRSADPVTRLAYRIFGRSPAWGMPLAVLVCFTGGIAYTLATHPTESGAFSSPTCLVKLTTGFDCPGCGGTRAFWYLIRGNVAAAARSHLMVVFAMPFLVYAYLAWAGRRVFGVRLPALRVSPRAISVFLISWAVFSVLRNLPFAPFAWFYV